MTNDMQTFIKLDANVSALFCCPVCKGVLETQPSRYICSSCRSIYPLVDVSGGQVYDFRIHRPAYLIPQSTQKWSEYQKFYEDWHTDSCKRDNLQEYLDEINSVREIYTTEFNIEGSVLDIGGHQGRLRHYLSDTLVPLYVSVDPLIDVFGYAYKPNLLKAYPSLLTPCNFLSCHAENLPFIGSSFDWVHMRSVVDHFADPYLAFKEAYRVLKPNGHLLIGLSIAERISASCPSIRQRIFNKFRSEGILPVLKTIIGKLTHMTQPIHDDHNVRLRYQELLDLISTTEFSVIKEHWQKPPYSYVIYISAKKNNINDI